MNNELRQERFVACDIPRWVARLAFIGRQDPRMLLARPMIAKVKEVEVESPLAFRPTEVIRADWQDDNDDTDVWGDPIPSMKMMGSVAVIPIKGIIATGYPSIYQKFGYCDLDKVACDLQKAMDDASCQAIALRVDSPGGTLRALPEFASMVAAANQKKLVAARIDGMGCSAAYYASAGAGCISCAPSASVVNIGVYQVNWDMTKAFEAFGYRVEVFKSGAYKAAGYPGTSLTDAQKTEIQDTVDSLGADFRAHVAANRPNADEANMQGQCFLGSKAVQLGFADDCTSTFAGFIAQLQATVK